MANEFIARKGLVVLESGIRVTGSSNFVGDVTASGNIRAANFYGSGQITGSFTGSFVGDGSQISGIATTLAFSGSTGNDVVNLKTEALTITGSNGITTTVTNNTVTINAPSGTVTASSQINHDATTNYVANQHIDHTTVSISAGSGLSGGGTIAATRTLTLDTGSSHFVTGSRATISSANTAGASGINLTYNTSSGIFSGSLVNSSVTVNGQTVSLGGSTTVTANTTNALTLGNGLTGTSFNGSTAVTATVDTGSAYFISGSRNSITFTDTAGASGIDFTYANGTASAVLQNSSITVSAGNGLSGGGSTALGSTTTLTLDTASAHFITGSVSAMSLRGVFSSSVQTDVRQTTGIGTIATTGSNTFTGVQTISNTTNSTTFADGALIVQGGVGIAKNVNISGSLTVTGILNAASMSVQYVTSSQLNVTDNKITVQTNDLVRFGGLSVYDSGSSNATASIYWDSQNHNFIYENLGGSNYNSAILIAGPKNTGTLGNETGLVSGRIPVATGGDHIDTSTASSSIYLDFSDRKTYVEAGLYVTGSVTSSVGFSGDGSNLTGIVTNLNLTGSQGGTGTVALKTQSLTVSGSSGISATVSGQTIALAGTDASTTAKGVASFNSTNFTVTSGQVTSNNITINGGTVTLGGTRNITLQDITTQGSTTYNQLTLNGGAIVHGVLFTSASATSIAGPVTNQVIATVATGSYDSAMFDYILKDGTNYRAGTVMAVWNSSTGYEFTDTSTNDIGNTAQAVLSVDTSGGNARLKLTLTSGTWTAKTAIRML